MDSVAPKLAAPGAGLPFMEYFVARYYRLPKYYRATSWDKAQAVFDQVGAKILDLARPLDDVRFTKPMLIKRVRGIEDSSRFWSVAMTLEHLVIVGDLMADGIVRLSRGEKPVFDRGVASLKPKGILTPLETRTQFEEFLTRFQKRMREEVSDRNSLATMDHPWFKAMTAHEWHCLAGLHQNSHRQQIKNILAGL